MGDVRTVVLAFADLEPRTAYDVWRLRQQVFVVEQECAYADLDGRDPDPDTRHVLALDGDLLLGYLRILREADHLRIGRVVAAPEARGRGVGDALVDAALESIGDRPSVLDAQSGLASWYARWGFVVTGPEFDDEGVLHVPMRRASRHGSQQDR